MGIQNINIVIKKSATFIVVFCLLALLGLAINNDRFVKAADIDTATVITVDSTLDSVDANIGNGECNDGAGNCTLRAAIQEANAEVGTQTIEFNIAPFDGNVKTFQPATSLPPIEGTVIIDGYSQDTASPNTTTAPAGLDANILIEIDGTNIVDTYYMGLSFSNGSNGSEVRGLAINRVPGTGIFVGANDITIQGNYIGTDPTGLIDLGNTGAGITNGNISNDDAIIGGTDPADRNLISGNEDAGSYPRNGWIIKGNYIGVDATGLAAMGNSTVGASGGLSIDDCIDVVVGGPEAGAINVISGNLSHGIAPDNADNLTIQGNYIGVGRDGTTTLGMGNGGAGIVLTNSENAQIGGYNSGEGNIVSNSGGDGIYLGATNTGVTVQGNTVENNGQDGISVAYGSGIIIGGTQALAGNTVRNSTFNGIHIFDVATDVTVQGNEVSSNTSNNIDISNVDGVVIGGMQAGAENTISDAGADGINVSNASSDITVQGNDITTSTGEGIEINGSSAIIGGTQAGAGNYITLNGASGLNINNTSSNVIAQGNNIEDNTLTGVNISDSDDITIGGALSGSTNTVSVNTQGGINLSSSTNVLIQDNVIDANLNNGVYVYDSPSTQIIENDVTDNSQDGIVVDTSELSIVSENTISGNLFDGIEATGSATTAISDNSVTGNSEDGIAIINSNDTTVTGDISTGNVQSGLSVGLSANVVISVATLSNNTANGLVSTSIDTALYDSEVVGNSDIGVSLSATSGTIIQGNEILSNSAANANGAGISLGSISNAIIGGTNATDRNTVSDNEGQANILVVGFGVPVNDNVIQGNYIGTSPSGTIDSNYVQNVGITLAGVTAGNIIGGTQEGSGNKIAGNNGAGIIISNLAIPNVFDFQSQSNSILGNSIVSNSNGTAFGTSLPGNGIELLSVDISNGAVDSPGPNVNDATDIDNGPNGYINYPVLHSASQSDSNLTLNLDLDAADSTLNDQYRVELFANDAADGSGYGEGQTYLGATTITNGDNQNTSITLPAGTNLTGKVLSATTTALTNDGDGFGSTSEFSETLGNVSVYITPTPPSAGGPLGRTGDMLASWYGVIGLIASVSGIAIYSKYYRFKSN